MCSKDVLLKIFMLTLSFVSGEYDPDKDKRVYQPPTLEDRQTLYSLYMSIPLPETMKRIENYEIIHSISKSYYENKIMEKDTLGWLDGKRQTIFHKLPYLIANPAFRTPHISKEWCESKEYFKIGFRVHQTTRELGLPVQLKCATCQPIIEGLNNIYYLFPERDFTQRFTKLPIETREHENNITYCSSSDCEQNPRVADFLDYCRENDLFFGKVTRWNGEHATTGGGRDVMGSPDGELAVHSREATGFSTMCGMELNGKVVSSNIFVNSDVIVPDDSNETFTYKNYESMSTTKTVSVKNDQLNLELYIHWEPWGCCSACCCPTAICGNEFQTLSDCDNVFSSRSRVGYLSIRKLKEMELPPQNQQLIELHRLLSIPPYTHQGIPLFSSLLHSAHFKDVIEKVKADLVPKFVEANKASGYQFSSGMFIDSESCKSNSQKTDCYEWARCHNVSLTEVSQDSSETPTDSCHQVHFVDVLVGVDDRKVTVGEHENLRIRMDSEVHDMKTISAKWRVNLRKPKKYNPSRPCLVQGIVQRGEEILILNFATWNLKIDLILENKKIRITFVNIRARESAQVVQYTIFYWAIAIIVFFLLLIAAIIFMHREKSKRLERAIKSVAKENFIIQE